MAKAKDNHYVNNREFTEAVVDYVRSVNRAKDNNEEIPKLPEYIGDCFLKICNKLSLRPNFIGYTFREEMIMDGVENLLRAIQNYNINAKTKSNKPNAFGYFTQIAWFAFLRKIAKENDYQEKKWKLIEKSGIDDFVEYLDVDANDYHVDESQFIDGLMDRMSEYRPTIKEKAKKETKETYSPLNKLFEGTD